MKNDIGIGPEQFIDCLALQGDKADNVPGIADVGPKTAIAWIQKYGSIDNLYAHADEITGKRGEALRGSKEIALLSKKLVTINCQSPIDIDYDLYKLHEPDKDKLAGIFTELGFSRLAKQLEIPFIKAVETTQSDFFTPLPIETLETIKTVEHDYQLVDTTDKFDAFINELGKQKLFAVDTETTSINPMRASLVGISVSWQKHKAFYLPIKAPMGQKYLDMKLVVSKLGPILENPDVKKIGQNIKYDLLVLENAGFTVKGELFDTMVASYCLSDIRRSNSMDIMAEDYLHYKPVPISDLIGKGKNQLTFDLVDSKTACEYSAEDADVTYQLYEFLLERLQGCAKTMELFEKTEMPLLRVLTKMERNGVSINVKLLKHMSQDLAQMIENTSEEIYKQAQQVFNIASPKQLAEVLFDKLGLNSTNKGKTARSTDADVLEEISDQHPIVPLILEHRQLSKLQNTYVEKLGSLINPATNRLHTSFNQTITVTGRLSSSDPNLQNIPIRTELGKKIRSAFVAEKETDCILSADYSQIELRLLAHFSKDKALGKAFAEDMDIHSFVASQIFGVPLDEVTSDMRSKSKAVNFGIIYGQGAFGLSRSVGIAVGEAKRFIDNYFARYSSIREFMDSTIEQAKVNGYVETMAGHRRKLIGLSSKNFNTRSQAERMAINTLIQGSAADMIKTAMINIYDKIEKENLPIKMILQIHDELVFELPIAESEKYAKWIADEMTGAVKLDVPLKVDVAIGPSWLEE
ncbi:MAG TPA: DNA polymerase I, partial [Sedimentisphaerales bacterium]|nr:DNA polymerase I [Sedimentisphaerales bacterium]